MSEPDKQYMGDGNDNYAEVLRNAAEAAKRFSMASSQAAAGTAGAADAAGAANAAASAVSAGIEGGAAVSEIAAGAAAGGPWGAAILAAWSARHTLLKVLVTVCLSLVFIIVLVVDLPSIVFNSIFHTDPSTVDASEPTDMKALYAEMSGVVAGCVNDGYEAAKAEVERIIAEGGYDHDLSAKATIDYGQVSVDYDVCYILAAYSASMNQKGTTKEDMKNKLEAVVPQMFKVTYEVKETTVTLPSGSSGEEAPSQPETETVQYVMCTIHSFDASVILTAFGIDPDAPYGGYGQRTGDVINNMATALKRTLYGTVVNGQTPPITDAELSAFLDKLACSPARKELIRAALSLVGRVPYFWGGKSGPGWNDEWNTPKLVTATGDITTGTLRPYGLDCSGFVDWVYDTALGISLPGGSAGMWNSSYAINEGELEPGDLGFLEEPSPTSTNHILIYAGRDGSGGNMWVHCNGDTGDVALNSPSYVRHYRRVKGADLDNMDVSGLSGG